MRTPFFGQNEGFPLQYLHPSRACLDKPSTIFIVVYYYTGNERLHMRVHAEIYSSAIHTDMQRSESMHDLAPASCS